MYQKMKSEHQKEHFRWTDGRTGLPLLERIVDGELLLLLPRELDKNKLFHFEAMRRGRNSRICNCIRGVFLCLPTFCPLPDGSTWRSHYG